MRDIVFYNLDFKKLYILPQMSEKSGYVSCNAQKELLGVGSIEAVFFDDELKNIVKENRDNLMFEWNGLFWFLCAYREEKDTLRITGESLNGLLRRSVIPPVDGTMENFNFFVSRLIRNYVPWLEYNPTDEILYNPEFKTTTYKSAKDVFEELFQTVDGGFEIVADIKNKKFILNVINPKKTKLILSDELLNIYDYIETYIGREVAHGGWYADASLAEQGAENIWQYITLDNTLSGVHKIDVVLKATDYYEAKAELQSLASVVEAEFKTKNITFNKDYGLGDIIRIQNKHTFTTKCVVGVIMSQENGYTESPIFKEVNE